MAHSLGFSRSPWEPSGRVLSRHSQWFPLLYGITVSVLANWVLPRTPATTALFTIAIGLPLIFRHRHYLWAIAGVVMVLIGVAWLYVLALR